MSDIRVLVSGASIAGPALAHWLSRRGAEVTVVERAPGLRPGGQAVDARGVAREVIRRMGLDAAVRAARTDTAGAHTVDADGTVLETFRADDNGGDGYISEIEILRGDLSQVLYDDTRDAVEYVFGDRIAELTQDADGVDVTFASGDRRRFDLVVAEQVVLVAGVKVAARLWESDAWRPLAGSPPMLATYLLRRNAEPSEPMKRFLQRARQEFAPKGDDEPAP